MKTHGMTNTPTFKSWGSMIQRCCNKNDSHYHRYGGRGIKICQRWKDSFQAFLDDMGERPSGLTLDRIDNDGDYEPANCRWADAKEQCASRTTTIFLEVDGEKGHLMYWSKKTGINHQTLQYRYHAGWDTLSPREYHQ